jgi:3-phenylpropionate/trans-cinnamate dioxygenase ferredoxin reductase component
VDDVVVVGAGLAGARTCQELRARGYAGRLIMVGAEPHRPYDRPPLSKQFLRGETDDTALEPDPVVLDGVDLRLGVTVTGLAPAEAGDPITVRTTAGDLRADAVVLATGATPHRLQGDPSGDAVALHLRTVDEARVLRDRIRAGGDLAIVGAGWIGAEVATAAAAAGCAVTVLEAAPAPVAAILGEEVGRHLAGWYAEAGVTLRTGTPVAGVDAHGVLLAGAEGERVRAGTVLVAVGVAPRLGWLAGSGVEVDDGVVTDAAGRTSVPGVYAVGDCARRWSPRAGRHVRHEHWDDALHQPEVVAAAVLGEPGGYDPVPYVWSEQFGRYVQWVGWRDGPPAVWRGDPAGGGGWAACWLDGAGRLSGFLAVDRHRDLVQARKAIAAGAVADPGRLADPDVPVRAAVRAS